MQHWLVVSGQLVCLPQAVLLHWHQDAGRWSRSPIVILALWHKLIAIISPLIAAFSDSVIMTLSKVTSSACLAGAQLQRVPATNPQQLR